MGISLPLIGQQTLHLRHIRLVGDGGASQGSLGLTSLAVTVQQMGFVRMGADNLSVLGKLKAFFGAGMSFELSMILPLLDMIK